MIIHNEVRLKISKFFNTPMCIDKLIVAGCPSGSSRSSRSTQRVQILWIREDLLTKGIDNSINSVLIKLLRHILRIRKDLLTKGIDNSINSILIKLLRDILRYTRG